jgi:hypothetical protein
VDGGADDGRFLLVLLLEFSDWKGSQAFGRVFGPRFGIFRRFS